VWHAIESTRVSGNSYTKQRSVKTSVVICSSSNGLKHATCAAQMIRNWFPNDMFSVEELIDDSSEWNFEIMVNGVLLHSMKTQWHGFLHDNEHQQSLVRRAVADLLHPSEHVLMQQ